MILRAPAKVNLCLRVGPLRGDGYHRLTTLFQAIDLYDELELEEAPETVVEGFPRRHAGRRSAGGARREAARGAAQAHPGRGRPWWWLVGCGGGPARAARRSRPQRAARDRPRARSRCAVLPHRCRGGLRHRPWRPHPARCPTSRTGTPCATCPCNRGLATARCSPHASPTRSSSCRGRRGPGDPPIRRHPRRCRTDGERPRAVVALSPPDMRPAASISLQRAPRIVSGSGPRCIPAASGTARRPRPRRPQDTGGCGSISGMIPGRSADGTVGDAPDDRATPAPLPDTLAVPAEQPAHRGRSRPGRGRGHMGRRLADQDDPDQHDDHAALPEHAPPAPAGCPAAAVRSS